MVGLSLAHLATAQTVAPNAVQEHVLPADSVYQLGVPLSDQNGRSFLLKEHLGKPVLVSMFYTSCKFVCPMLIDSMVLTQQGLSLPEQSRLDLLLITFDPERDDVKKLKSVAVARQVDGGPWTLARADSMGSRKLAATFGIQYRQLPDGEFNHTTVMVLLDSQGRIVGRSKKMGVPDPDFIQLVQKTIHQQERP
ncbi:SCO family protein [Rhodoferax sp. GW822-FHT02A01]|uniref:SCO family protein n=1 Tax=Rhodoferax sp. GW822-FHT02A01 TaxID=3141537 RepID=UPI00315D8C38